MNLLVLSHLVDDPQWTERIERTLRLFGARLEQIGRAVPMMAAALSDVHGRPAADRHRRKRSSDDGAMAAGRSRCRYLPFAVDPPRHAAIGGARLAGSLPFLAAMEPVDGTTAAYVCRDFTCRQPVTTVDALQQELKAAS